jgi:hypothetical protein
MCIHSVGVWSAYKKKRHSTAAAAAAAVHLQADMVQIWCQGGCVLAWVVDDGDPRLMFSQVGTGCFNGVVLAHEARSGILVLVGGGMVCRVHFPV